MAFEKVILLSGEPRAEYVERRLKEGAATASILAEINAPELFSGTAGAPWGVHVVNAAKHKLQPKAQTAKADLIGEAHPTLAEIEASAARNAALSDALLDPTPKRAVPAEAEGILDADDVAEVYAEAQKEVLAKQRKDARAALLKKAKEELAREAKEALKRSAPRGDQVDVYIDLAPYGGKEGSVIRLDGEEFWHGRTYRVRRDVGQVLMEQCQRSWQHQESTIGGRKESHRQRSAISASGGAFLDGQMVRA